MFGGWGVYHSDFMFGLIAFDTLYLKVDEQNRGDFTARGLGPFVYDKDGKKMAMSYFQAPDEALEDPDAAQTWGQSAIAAAQRTRHLRPKPRPQVNSKSKPLRGGSPRKSKQSS
jgi:DNA transformation protein